MARNKKGKNSNEDLGFGDLEDSFFASGDFGWDEEPSEPEPAPAAEPPAAEEPPPAPEPEPVVEATPPPPVIPEPTPEPEPIAETPPPPVIPEPTPEPEPEPEPEPVVEPPVVEAPPPAPEPEPEPVAAAPPVEELPEPEHTEDLPTESISPASLLSSSPDTSSAEADFFGDGGFFDEPAAEPAVAEPAAPPAVEEPEEPSEEDYSDEDEAVFADDFVDGAPDETMILRRKAGSAPAALGDDYSDDEIARARAEREARRQIAAEEPPAAEEPLAEEAELPEAEPASVAIPEPEPSPVIEETSRVAATPAIPILQVPSPPITPASSTRSAPAEEPAPPSVSIRPPEPPPRQTVPEPVLAAATPAERVARYEPSPEATGRWSELARALELEAETVSDPAARAKLQAEAGQLYFSRLGQWEQAGRLFASAVGAGIDDPAVLKSYGDVVANQTNYPLLRDILVQRAGQSEGPSASEALQDAVLVERNILRQDAAAIALLRRSLEITPGDWFALRLLRDLENRSRNWTGLVEVLERMARLTTGPRAARLLVERGRVFEDELDNLDAAAAAYDAAWEHDPSYGAAFLSVERIARMRGDSERLIGLYTEEASRTEGSNAAFWLARAARVSASGASHERTADLYTQATERAGPAARELRHEAQSFYASAGMWEAVTHALSEEAEHLTGQDRAFVLYRLGRTHERQLSQIDESLAAYRGAVEADPAAGPAAEAVTRLLTDRGEYREVLEFLSEYITRLDDPHLAVTTLYRMGELCEGPLGDQEGARKHFEAILDTAPGYLPALEGLERVYTRLEAWDSLAAVYEQRALLCEDPQGIALQLHRAGAVCEFRLAEHARARDFYCRALEQVADFPPSLDAYARILEAEGDWAQLARILSAAAKVTRDSTRSSA